MTTDLSRLETRLAALERQNRILRWAGSVAAGLLAVVLLTSGEGRGKDSAPAAERVKIVTDKDGPRIDFFDEDGKVQSTIRSGPHGLTLRFGDARGRLFSGVGLEKGGLTFLSFDETAAQQVGPNAVKTLVGPTFEGETRNPAPFRRP